MKKKNKKKLSWVAVGNMVGLISSALVILDTVYQIIIKPFFTNEPMALTQFGLITIILAFIVCGANFNYFEERMER